MRSEPVLWRCCSGQLWPAQDIAGDWQGTLKAGAQELRVVLAIDNSTYGNWSATFSSIDQSPDWVRARRSTRSLYRGRS
jgi:hypothetical protein